MNSDVSFERTRKRRRPREAVVVVGGGLAGLTAAYSLRATRPLVLEKEAFVGGRTHSERLDDLLWINLGAQWLPLEAQELAFEVGVDIKEDTLPPPALYVKGKRVIESNPVMWFLKLPFALRARIDFLKLGLRLWSTLRRYDKSDSKTLENVTLAEWLGKVHPDMADLVAMWSTMAGARDPSELSARAGLEVVNAALGRMTYHGAPYNIVVGGTSLLAHALAHELGDRVVTSAKVTSVEQDERSVQVTYLHEGVEDVVEASECVIAVPAPIALQICGKLPESKIAALRALPWARHISAGIVVDGAPAAPWDRMYWMRVGGPVIVSLLNPSYFFDAKDAGPHRSALSAMINGHPADDLWELPDEAIRSRVRAHFEEVFPEARGYSTVPMLHRWEFAYPTFPPGYEKSEEQRAASCGRLHFCGDYLLGIGTDFAVRTGAATGDRVGAALAAEAVRTSAPSV